MAKQIQLLSKGDNGFVIETEQVFRVLDKIGDKNVAIVSINGNKRTGKSFLLNYFLRYLRYNKTNGNEWIKEGYETMLEEFDWKCGERRHTSGIWLWSEPFIIKDKDDNDIAVLLMDTQAGFDDQTPFQEFGLQFSLSLLLSSTFIYNIRTELSEDNMQFVEFFASFAKQFIGELETNGSLYQKLVFLVRDWEYESAYPYGYHDQCSPKHNNYVKAVINPNSGQCFEAQNTRKEILRNFNYVSSYLMPHPGKNVSKLEFNGQIESMDTDFIESITKFVPLILDGAHIEPKKFGYQLLTGNSIKQYITKLAQIITEQPILEVKSLVESSAEIIHMLEQKRCLSEYEERMRSLLADRNSSEEALNANHEIFKQQALNHFKTEPKFRIILNTKQEMVEELSKMIDKNFEIFRSNNMVRINKEESEQRMNEVVADMRQLQQQKSQLELRLADMQYRIDIVKEESEKRELRLKKEFIEQEARLDRRIMQLQLEIADAKRANERTTNESVLVKLTDLKRELKPSFGDYFLAFTGLVFIIYIWSASGKTTK